MRYIQSENTVDKLQSMKFQCLFQMIMFQRVIYSEEFLYSQCRSGIIKEIELNT